MKRIRVEGLGKIVVTGSMELMQNIIPTLNKLGFEQIAGRENAYEFSTGIDTPLAFAFDEDPKITFLDMPISRDTAKKIANALIEEVKLRIGYSEMPNRFSAWAEEINKDWTRGYAATATDEALVVSYNAAEVARIDYNNGRYTVTGSDNSAVEQLEFMLARYS